MNECNMGKCLGPVKYRYEIFKRNRWKEYLKDISIIAPSMYLENEIRKRGLTRVTTIHNGVPAPDKIIRKTKGVGSAEEVFHLIFTGRLYPEKGVIPMLKAFERFLAGMNHRKRDGIKLTVTGDGPLKGELRDYSRRYTEIDYLGFIPRKRLSEILSSASFLVMPSIWPENCSMAVLEAMRQGIPVIASNMGGTPELVQDRKEAYIMDFVSIFSSCRTSTEEKIIKLLENTFKRAYSARERIPKMAKSCKRAIEKRFSSDIMADRIITQYRKLG
jgi:glycosyltransferase involved in cell wall biosynthesis